MGLGRQFVVRVDGLKKLNKKFNDIIDFARLRVGNLTKEEAETGASMAASLAPHFTGSLIQAIGWGRRANRSYEITSKQPKKRGNRPYHLWMHGLGMYDISGRIRSGNPKYMFVTYNVLSSEYPRIVSRELGKVIKK